MTPTLNFFLAFTPKYISVIQVYVKRLIDKETIRHLKEIGTLG